MWHKSGQKFRLGLMLGVMSCLSSCAPAVCECEINPVFPYAGAPVANELQNLSATEYPYLWEWIGRLNKLRMELEN
ncbi:MAG: hypothetical protein VZR95_07380 [Alphaproteobacteria bacterium]